MRFVAVERDITYRKQHEQDLLQQAHSATKATDAKSGFITLLTHELNAPIKDIVDISQQLKRITASKKDIQDLAIQLNRSGEVVRSVFDNITTLSDIDNRGIQNEKFDINQLLSSVTKDAEQLAQCRKIAFNMKSEFATEATLVGDTEILHHILFFFVFNAIKQSEAGGVSLRVKPSYLNNKEALLWQLEYGDRGKSYKQIQSLMDSHISDDPDTFIGYHAVFKILSKLNGLITLERSDPFTTCISIQIPAKQILSKKVTQRLNKDTQRLMIAEDNKVNAMVLTKLLQSLGFEYFDLAKNGQEAIELARQHDYYAILMDNHMPVMTGIDATKIIKEEVSPDVTIIACTADTSSESRQIFLDNGATDVIFKPINKKKLASVLGVDTKAEGYSASEEVVGAWYQV